MDRHSRRVILGWIAAMACSGTTASDGAEGGTSPEKSGFTCGTMSLATLLRLEGMATPPDRVAAALPKRDEHSMAELVDAARQFGLTIRGVRLVRRDWPLDRPALAHVDRQGAGHFVVIRPVGSSGRLVQVIDPVEGSTVEEADRVFASAGWTGVALIPSRLKDGPLGRLAPFGGTLMACLTGAFMLRRIARRRG